jgi:YggT family protein
VGLFFRNFIELLALALTVLILGRVLISWVDPTGRGQAARFLIQTTEPILAPIRRVLPNTGMIDLSPMIMILLLTFIMQAIRA